MTSKKLVLSIHDFCKAFGFTNPVFKTNNLELNKNTAEMSSSGYDITVAWDDNPQYVIVLVNYHGFCLSKLIKPIILAVHGSGDGLDSILSNSNVFEKRLEHVLRQCLKFTSAMSDITVNKANWSTVFGDNTLTMFFDHVEVSIDQAVLNTFVVENRYETLSIKTPSWNKDIKLLIDSPSKFISKVVNLAIAKSKIEGSRKDLAESIA
jgi:hypothetical protein